MMRGRSTNEQARTIAEKARLRDSVSFRLTSANRNMHAANATDVTSKDAHRSRSALNIQRHLIFHSNQSVVCPPCVSLRHASMTTSGRTMTDVCIAASNPALNQV